MTLLMRPGAAVQNLGGQDGCLSPGGLDGPGGLGEPDGCLPPGW